jgi:hypothetical protein
VSGAPIEAFLYRGHSLGLAGTIAVILALAARLGVMFWRRRNRG